MNEIFVYITVGTYLLFGSIIAYMAREGIGQSIDDYFIGGRNIGGLVSALTYSATTYSAFMMVGLVGLAYQGGVGALGFELTYLMGLALTIFFGPRFWIAGKNNDYITPNELLGDRYESEHVAIVSGFIYLIFLIPYASAQIMGIGYVLNGITGGSLNYLTAIIIAALVAVLWAWMAGMKSVAWTDAVQSGIMLVSATLVLIFAVQRSFGGFGNFMTQIESNLSTALTVKTGMFDFKTFLGLTIPWFFFSISNPQVSQRLFIPDSLNSLRKMIKGFLVFGFIYTLITVLWGFYARLKFPNLLNPDRATPQILSSGVVPNLLALIVMVGILAAAISTIDSIVLSLSSITSRDIVRNIAGKKEIHLSPGLQLGIGKIIIPILTLIALAFASLQLNLISLLSVSASAGLLVTVPPIVGAFFWKKGTSEGSLAGMMFGALVTGYLYISGTNLLGFPPGVWSAVISTMVFVCVSLVTESPARADSFIDNLNEELDNYNII